MASSLRHLRLDKLLHKLVPPVIFLLAGFLTIDLAVAHSEKRFLPGQPVKEFEVLHKDFFCDTNNKKEGSHQCSRMNANYLKFYFSVFFTIAWGGAVRTVIKTFELSIPYTVVLLITGLILGLGSRVNVQFCETWSMFTKFARTPPELILYIFLPLLIFESAFSMKAHVFMSSFVSILVVALPGMLLSTFVTAIGCRQFMASYGWTFSQASLFGAIISATDPVAVVAILRELGTSENLSVMIEGESLLNDGVAILLYEIFKEIVETPESNEDHTLKITWQFVRIAIGGPTFGYLMGKISIWCLSIIFNDAATEITITLVAAYLTYFLGEFYLGVSGVMAVVLLGVTISASNTCISPEVMHAVHQFWQMMSFLANTVLFVVLGIVISETAINSFTIEDGYNVIWLYFALSIIRMMMLILLSPILARVGYDATWRNLTVMMWGGLRGAVGICLALEVYKSKKLCGFPSLGPKFLLQTAGIVIMTLIVNGTTTKSLLDYLGVTTLSAGKLQDMANAVKNLTAARVRTIIALKHDRFLADANWEIVHKFTHLKDPYAKRKGYDDRTNKNIEQKLEQLLSVPLAITNKLPEGSPLSLSPHNSTQKVDKRNSPILLINVDKSVQDLNLKDFKSQPSQSLMFIHQGKKIPALDPVDEAVAEEEANTDSLDPSGPEFKRMMEECRGRVLKSMKISCWTQYEKGSLSEEAVKVVVSAIEAKEDEMLSMIHVEDLRENWAIKGFFSWIRNKIYQIMEDETLPPMPKAKWRHPIYWLTTQSWFHGIIYFIIFLNLGPIIVETQNFILETNPEEGAEKEFLYACTLIFTSLYFLEFVLKIIGRGWADYCGSKWNILDFLVLAVALVELGFTITAHHHLLELEQGTGKNKASGFGTLKILRLVRFVRLLRWARPLLPILNRVLEIRINARLFKGYDVGNGFIQALEDALRYLPTMIHNRKIALKFKSVLDNDRVKTVKELALLQMKHPGVVVAVKTRQASRAICGYMIEELQTMKFDGLLEENEYELLKSKIDGNLKKLWASPSNVKIGSPEAMVDHLPWAVGSLVIRSFFQENKELKKFSSGDIIYSVGDLPNGIHLIISGLVKLRYDPTESIVTSLLEEGIVPNTEFYLDMSFYSTAFDFMGIGTIFGEYGYLTKIPRAASIICETDVELYHWSNDVVDEAYGQFDSPYNSLESRLWRSFGIRLAAEFLHSEGQYSSWTSDKIRAHLEEGVVPVGDIFNNLEIPHEIEEVILIYGELKNLDSGETIIAPALVPHDWHKIGPKEGYKKHPRVILIPHEDDLGEIQDREELSPMDHCILNAPGVAMALLDEETPGAKKNRRKSMLIQSVVNYSARRKSTLEKRMSVGVARWSATLGGAGPPGIRASMTKAGRTSAGKKVNITVHPPPQD